MSEAEKRVVEAQDADVRLAAAVLVRDKLAEAAEAAASRATCLERQAGTDSRDAATVGAVCPDSVTEASAEAEGAAEGSAAAALLWGRVAMILRQVPGVSGGRVGGGDDE